MAVQKKGQGMHALPFDRRIGERLHG